MYSSIFTFPVSDPGAGANPPPSLSSHARGTFWLLTTSRDHASLLPKCYVLFHLRCQSRFCESFLWSRGWVCPTPSSFLSRPEERVGFLRVVNACCPDLR